MTFQTILQGIHDLTRDQWVAILLLFVIVCLLVSFILWRKSVKNWNLNQNIKLKDERIHSLMLDLEQAHSDREVDIKNLQMKHAQHLSEVIHPQFLAEKEQVVREMIEHRQKYVYAWLLIERHSLTEQFNILYANIECLTSGDATNYDSKEFFEYINMLADRVVEGTLQMPAEKKVVTLETDLGEIPDFIQEDNSSIESENREKS